MNTSKKPLIVEDGMVVTLDYTLTVDGEVVDTSKDSEPIQFIQGSGQIIPGLEKALYGMAVGDSKEVVIVAADAYGEVDPNAFADIPRREFPPEIPLKPGVELQLRNMMGEELVAQIVSVDEEHVRLNFNHPLAGKDLNFTVQIAGLRFATPVELEHGHVHEEGQEP